MTDWRTSADQILTELPIGSVVKVSGGFENGIIGHLVGARKHAMADYPVFYVADRANVYGGFDYARLDRVEGPEFHEYTEADGEPYVLECYRCGAIGTNHVFGWGYDRQCPNPDCRSYEVHSAKLTKPVRR